ncbi:uncharacterized protein [Musca autumnalis]|uniref:uncharacterized protein n=1 Tax=Musca autumnalis TaxID=221902 RepID=UPI003CF55553
MIIVLLLFFKSICLYCQRLVLHIHDRWINPKNARLIKEAAEAKGSKFHLEDYRQSRKAKRRRHTTAGTGSSHYTPSTAASTVLSSLGTRAENCRFCANTPQGYCRHHFHLQELQVHKQQQSIWCPLSGGLLGRNVEYKQLRKIKRELKRTLHHQQQQQRTADPVSGETSSRSSTLYQPVAQNDSESLFDYDVTPSSSLQDSGYQSIANHNSTPSTPPGQQYPEEGVGEEQQQQLLPEISLQSSQEFLDLPTPSGSSLVETTYSFETCCETPVSTTTSSIAVAAALPRVASNHSFVSCTSSTISTSHL